MFLGWILLPVGLKYFLVNATIAALSGESGCGAAGVVDFLRVVLVAVVALAVVAAGFVVVAVVVAGAAFAAVFFGVAGIVVVGWRVGCGEDGSVGGVVVVGSAGGCGSGERKL